MHLNALHITSVLFHAHAMPDIDQVISDGHIAFRYFFFKNTDPIIMQQ